MSKSVIRAHLVFIIAFLAFFVFSRVATAASITDYLVWGEGVTSDSSTAREGVFVGPGSIINGNVGSRGDVQTNGTVGINGDAYSGSQTIFSTATTRSR